MAKGTEEAAAAGSPAVGREAPDFTLSNQNDQPVHLKDLRGHWVVLYFYPKDETPGCTMEAAQFSRLLPQFHDLDAVVYGVSDNSPASHRKFIADHSLRVNLLSDHDHKVMKQYGAWVMTKVAGKTHWRAIRTTFLISPDGIIRFHWMEVMPRGHAQRVLEKLKAIEHQQ